MRRKRTGKTGSIADFEKKKSWRNKRKYSQLGYRGVEEIEKRMKTGSRKGLVEGEEEQEEK